MQIQNILERAKFSKQKVLVFHGTSKKHLRSIIANGLLINHSEGGLGSDEDREPSFNFSFDPHEGVYFTTSFPKAEFFAKSIDYNNPIVIVAEIQPKSVHLDEDNIMKVLGDVGDEIARKLNLFLDKYGFYNDDDESTEELQNIEEQIISTTLQNLEKNLSNVYGLTPTTIQNIIKRSESYIENYIKELINGYLDGNSDVRREQEVLLKAFKHIVRKNIGDEEMASSVFSVPYNVGFRGSNKIVGIIDITGKKAWGKHPRTNFTTVSTPIELLNSQ